MKALAYLIAGSVFAYAGVANAASDTQAEATASDAPASENDIIVTAQHRAERVQDVPISMTVLNSDNLRAAGVTDLRSLETVTPGLSMQQQNGYVNPSIRGVTTSTVTAGAENPIAVYLDGVYVSNMGASTFSLPDVDQIEVLKGPQGTLFGRNATGGAVRITTKKPSMTPTGEIAATAGMYTGAGSSRSAYDLNVKGYVSGPLVQDKIAASIAFSKRKSNGYGTNVAYGRVSPEVDRAYGNDRVEALEDTLFRGKLLVTPSENFSVLFTGFYTHTLSTRNQGGYVALDGTALTPGELAFPGRVSPTRPWQSSYDAHEPRTKVDTRGGSMVADLDIEGAGTLTSTTAYSFSKYSEWNDSDASYIPGCLAAFACTAPFDSITDKGFQQEFLFASKKFGALSFVAGANYYHGNATVDVTVNDFPFGAPPPGGATNPDLFHYNQQVKTRSYGIFAEANYDITDALTMIAGLRYSDEKKTGVLHSFGGIDFNPTISDGAGGTIPNPNFFKDVLFLPPELALKVTAAKKWTPRFSLRYAIDSRTNVYFTFSQGFKSGVIPGGAPANPVVKPERLTAYEIGFKTSQPDYTFNAAAFYYDYKDIQVQSNGDFGGVINNVLNAGKGRIWGFDVDGSWHVSDAFSVRGGVSWIPYAKYIEYKGAPIVTPRCVDSADPTNVDAVPGPGVFCPGTNIDLSGTRMFKTPKVTANFSMTYAVETGGGKLTFTPNVYYASKLFTDPTHLDALSTDNFKLGAEIAFTPDDRPWRLALWGKNLTNDDAFISLSNNGNAFLRIPGDPMEIGLTATFGF